MFPEETVDARLAQAMLLFRASTMKMLQLQLAMERRDRAVALQSMDDLVELDERMADFLGHIPTDESIGAIVREVEGQRSALLREKFGLAAGIARRPAEPAIWVEPEKVQAEPVEVAAGEPAERRRWLLPAAVALYTLVAAALVAAVVLGWWPAF